LGHNQQKTGPTAKNGHHLENGSHHWGQKRILKAKTKALQAGPKKCFST
jgi:hypothetical protein